MSHEDIDIITRRADSLIEDHAALRARLIELRKEHNFSRTVVAERIGVSQPTVAGFERYDANPTQSTLRRYALAVGARVRTTVIDDCAEVQAAFVAVGVITGTVLAPATAPHGLDVTSWVPRAEQPTVHAWAVGYPPCTRSRRVARGPLLC